MNKSILKKPIKRKNRPKKPKITLLKQAQVLFNNFIKERDRNKEGDWTCISCGKKTIKPNASYYASIFRYLHLRFNEDNVHVSCIRCNKWGEGNLIGFRKGLIKKIGIKKVEQLEKQALNETLTKKFTESDIKTIKTLYITNKK